MHNRVQRSGPTTTATATVPTPPSALVSSTSTALSATSSRYSLRTSVTPVFDPSYSWSEKHTQGAGPRTAAIKPTPSPSPDHTTATTTRANPRRTARRKSTTHPQSFPFSRKSASTARPFAIKMTSKCNNFLPALFRMCNNDDGDHREVRQCVGTLYTHVFAFLLSPSFLKNFTNSVFSNQRAFILIRFDARTCSGCTKAPHRWSHVCSVHPRYRMTAAACLQLGV